MKQLDHDPGCPIGARIEEFEVSVPTGRWTLRRCGDCGNQVELLLEPGLSRDDRAELHPQVVARGLAPDERHDPERNPLHPLAGVYMRRPAPPSD